MKAVLALLCIVALASQCAALETTLGDLVSGLCPEATLRLQQNTLLNTAISLASSTPLVVPDDGVPVLLAPNDAALMAALPKLGLTLDQLAASPDAIAAILSQHIAYANGYDVSEAMSLNGEPVLFTARGAPIDLNKFETYPDPASLAVAQGGTLAGVEQTVSCPFGAVAIFVTDAFIPSDLPTPAPTPAPAPAPGPAPAPVPATLGALLDSLCPEVKTLLADPELSILTGAVLPIVADLPVRLPPGPAVIVAPTDAAFQALLATGIDPNLASNKTLVAELIANHLATASSPAASSAETLYGEELFFLDADANTTLALLPTAAYGAIKDTDDVETAAVEASATCGTAVYAFKVDAVMVPAKYEPKPAPAPAPAPAPVPVPVPSPPPPSAGVRAGVAAAAALAAAVALLA